MAWGGGGGGVTGSGGIDRPLTRGMTTGLSAGREALRNVDVAIGAVGRPGSDNRRTHVIETGDIGVFLGLDVGKGEHHATAVTPAERPVDDVFTALDEQTVVVPGTDAAALIVPSLTGSLHAVLDQRKLLAARIEELLEAHPLSRVLTSMPGIGVRTGARILIDVGDAGSFPSAAHLAAYAGLAPATRSSGFSIRGEQPSRRGNKQLKRAFFLSAFAALADPASRSYDRKIAQGKHHTQTLPCLARRRADVLFAMLRDGTFYEPRPAAA